MGDGKQGGEKQVDVKPTQLGAWLDLYRIGECSWKGPRFKVFTKRTASKYIYRSAC